MTASAVEEATQLADLRPGCDCVNHEPSCPRPAELAVTSWCGCLDLFCRPCLDSMLDAFNAAVRRNPVVNACCTGCRAEKIVSQWRQVWSSIQPL